MKINKKLWIIVPLFLNSLNLFCQFIDDFSDGDYNQNPKWIGDTGSFQITNNQLQLNAPLTNQTAFLFTPSKALIGSVYTFEVNLTFNPSPSNYGRVYLASSNLPIDHNTEGYFVQIGGESGNTDRVSLYHQNGTTTNELIHGGNGTAATAPHLMVKVTHLNGEWKLYLDPFPVDSFLFQGTAIHKPKFATEYFGVYCTFSSSRADKFFFDSFQVTGTPFIDTIPLQIDSLYSSDPNEIVLIGSEPFHSDSTSTSNVFIPNFGSPDIILLDSNKLQAVFSDSLPLGDSLEIICSGLLDTNLNLTPDTIISYIPKYHLPVKHGEIVINEIFSDPTPSNGLPETEYIELLNVSNTPIWLQDFSFSDLSTTTPLPNQVLFPGDFILLFPEGSPDLNSLDNSFALNPWPSLNNDEDHLLILDHTSQVIDSVFYQMRLFSSEKKSGGWSLEKVFPKSPCSIDQIWNFSENPDGGTPGYKNSVHEIEGKPLQLITYSQTTLNQIHLFFNQEIYNPNDTLLISCNPSTISANGLFNPNNELAIQFSQSIPDQFPLQLDLPSISGCYLNVLQESHLEVQASKWADFQISEVLQGENENSFIEFLNTSDRTLNIQNWSLQYLNLKDDTTTYYFQHDPYLVLSKHFRVLASDSESISVTYPICEESHYLPESSSKIFDAEGVYYLYNSIGKLIDSLHVQSSLYPDFVLDSRQISLERFQAPSAKQNIPLNISTSPYLATPGCPNSNWTEVKAKNKAIYVEPPFFSPNEDGQNDRLVISFPGIEETSLATLNVYTPDGILIKNLFSNSPINNTSKVFWDGSTQSGQIGETGMYLVVLFIFQNGGTQRYKISTALINKG